MACSPHGSAVLTEVLLACESGTLSERVPEEKKEAYLESLVGLVGVEQEGGSVLDDFYGSRTLQNLVVVSCSEGKSVFAKKFWTEVAESKCAEWKGTHAEKILRAYSKSSIKKAAQKASKHLSKK